MSSPDMFSSSPSAAGHMGPRCWAEGRLQTCLPLASSCWHNMRPPEPACQWLGSSSCLGYVCVWMSGKADPARACEHPSQDSLAVAGGAGSPGGLDRRSRTRRGHQAARKQVLGLKQQRYISFSKIYELPFSFFYVSLLVHSALTPRCPASFLLLH